MARKKKENVVNDVTKSKESNILKPTAEEIALYKQEFEEFVKSFETKTWTIGEPNAFIGNKYLLFLKDFIENHSAWKQTGWMGLLKMKETLDNIQDLSQGLKLNYQALEFCGYMLMNPGGIGLNSAIQFEKIAETYAELFDETGKQIENARKDIENIRFLQERWAAAEQGAYLTELATEENDNDETFQMNEGNE